MVKCWIYRLCDIASTGSTHQLWASPCVLQACSPSAATNASLIVGDRDAVCLIGTHGLFKIVTCLSSLACVPTRSAIRQANCLHRRTQDHHRVSTCGCLPHDGSTSMVMTVQCRVPDLLQHCNPRRWLCLGFRTTFVTVFERIPTWLSSACTRMSSSRRLLGWKCARGTSYTRIVRSPSNRAGQCVFHL